MLLKSILLFFFCFIFFFVLPHYTWIKSQIGEFKLVFVSQAPEFTDYSFRADSEGNIWTL